MTPPHLMLRPAAPEDAPAAAELFIHARRTCMGYLPDLHTDEETRRFIRDVVFSKCEVWLAESGGSLAGFVALHGGWLEHLYVGSDLQGRGIGSALLAKAKALRPDGFRLWVFQRNVRARRFYERHGLELLRRTDGSGNEEREPDAEYGWRPA